MTSNFETIRFEQVGEIGILTISRPAKLNALSIQVHRELKDFLSTAHKAGIKGLILIGEGEKAFVAGADIAEMQPMSPGEGEAFSELGQQVTLLLERLPYPTIAAVNGFALGGGFEMALACDFIFASENAVFGLPEVKLGLIPGFGGTQRLARIVGERRAKEIMFSGRNVKCEEAKKLGIALESFPDRTSLLDGCRKWFELTLANSDHAIAKAKLALTKPGFSEMDKGLKLESEEFGKIFQTPQMIEGTTAFVEKRKANFK